MNKNIDLTKILKDCPKGWEFWSDNYGKVEFLYIDTSLDQPILIRRADRFTVSYTKGLTLRHCNRLIMYL